MKTFHTTPNKRLGRKQSINTEKSNNISWTEETYFATFFKKERFNEFQSKKELAALSVNAKC